MSDRDEEKVRVQIRVTGRVQGVGFRAHVEYHGRKLGLSGWVRNVGYDTVEAEAEGPRDVVERFVELVKQGPRASRVDEAQVEFENATGEFQTFEVRRSR